MSPEPELRRLTLTDVAPVGALLGRAFQDNPGYLATLAHLDAGARARAVRVTKASFTAAAVRHLEAEGLWLDGRCVAASLVFPPDAYPPSVPVMLRVAAGPVRLGVRAIGAFLRMDAWMRARHHHGRHYYLFVLGVEPEYQGRGLGKVLLRRLAERADRAGVPCYLETDRETSVRLYQGAGYRVLTDETLPQVGGLRMWTMLRPARAEAAEGELSSP